MTTAHTRDTTIRARIDAETKAQVADTVTAESCLVSLDDIEDITHEIRQNLRAMDVESVIIFGSYARGRATQTSDIDVYVVTKDDFIPATWRESKNIYARVSTHLLGLQQKIPVDLLVHTKKMRDAFLHNNPDFAHHIYDNGVHIL